MVRPGAAARRSRPKAGVRLIIWCRDCRHQVEPDPAEQAQRYGAEMTLPDWRERLVCSKCGSRHIDMVVSGIQAAMLTCRPVIKYAGARINILRLTALSTARPPSIRARPNR